MTGVFYTLLAFLAIITPLRRVRFIWMTRQALVAIRRDLSSKHIDPTSIQRDTNVFRDLGSLREALWGLYLDHTVTHAPEIGEEERLWYTMEFAPILGRFRKLELNENMFVRPGLKSD